MEFRLGELFSGPGGIGFGAKNAEARKENEVFSISHAWATDYDKDSCETYKENICGFNSKSVIAKDIRTLAFSELENISPIDALAFGFPCNDFSVVGEQKGINGLYGPLFRYGVEALNFFKPLWFLAENVSGLRNANDGKALNVILRELSSSDYKIYPHLYKFEEYGVPQMRHRIIIVGIRNDLNVEFKIPSPLPYRNVDISARNALENPPIARDALNHEFTKQSKTVVERLRHIKPGENAFTADIPPPLQLKVAGATISQIYKRLSPNKPAYTITGSGGGGTHVYHWNEPRALTNRERARLQTFPDNFRFAGSKESVRKQVGMAVPPRAAKIIFESILCSFANIPYPSVPTNILYSKQQEFAY